MNDVVKSLLLEIIDEHSDPARTFYNECDESPCFWCELAMEQIKLAEDHIFGGDGTLSLQRSSSTLDVPDPPSYQIKLAEENNG